MNTTALIAALAGIHAGWVAHAGVPQRFSGSPAREEAFLRALARQDQRFDPAEHMIAKPFSSPGYHTALKGGTVHPTRDSLNYAVALLDAGGAARLARAEDILGKVISLQDQDPESRTYGIWSWFLEEPLEQMAPPDWNWADFCGTQLLQVALDHRDRLAPEVSREVREAILHAARSIKRRNVGPGYTNIALMGAYVTLAAGERFEDTELMAYGKSRLKRFLDHTRLQGSFTEYNSPTYTAVAIAEISRLRRDIRDPNAREMVEELNRTGWRHLARHFHPPTRQWAGPHSRSYATLLRDGTLAFIQRGTTDRVTFLPEGEAWEDLRAHRLPTACPAECEPLFLTLGEARSEVETFSRNGPPDPDVVGTTYLHPEYTLGTVNVGDLWNQRRPLVAYWGTPAGVAAMRLRCLHDDYDYASASLFTAQHHGDVLGAVAFATDRGDTHLSIDRIQDGAIRARDLRVRLQFEGALADLALPRDPAPGRPLSIRLGGREVRWRIDRAVFGPYPPRMEAGRDAKGAFVDLVLYRGPEKEIRFPDLDEAVVLFTLSVDEQTFPEVESSLQAGERGESTVLSASWKDLALGLPVKPMKGRDQRRAVHLSPFEASSE